MQLFLLLRLEQVLYFLLAHSRCMDQGFWGTAYSFLLQWCGFTSYSMIIIFLTGKQLVFSPILNKLNVKNVLTFYHYLYVCKWGNNSCCKKTIINILAMQLSLICEIFTQISHHIIKTWYLFISFWNFPFYLFIIHQT